MATVTAAGPYTISDGSAGTVAIDLPITGPDDESTPAPTAVDLHLRAGARLRVHQRPSSPAPPRRWPTLKLTPGIVVTTPEPVIADGRPYTPRFRAINDSTVDLVRGFDHAKVVSDPDPVWTGGSYGTPPPHSPGGLIRWSARTLPDFGAWSDTTPGGTSYYKLGDLDTVDNTDGYDTGAASWHSADGSDVPLALHSAYPFKPTVVEHVHLNTVGGHGKPNRVTTPKCVKLNSDFVEHLWADMGVVLTPPFTILMAGIILTYPRRGYRHYLLDSGSDPTDSLTTSTRKNWLNKGVTGTTVLDENYGYRTALAVTRERAAAWNTIHPDAHVARVHFEHTLTPKVWAYCNQGAGSYVAVLSRAGKHVKRAFFPDHGNQRQLVIGRRNGRLDADQASDMLLFEIRVVMGALDPSRDGDLEDHYGQLASTWRFMEHS